MERHVAGSFVFPLRPGGLARRWLVGTVLVALLPVSFPLVFGYAVACIRMAAIDAAAPPPAWRPGRRLVLDGACAAIQAAALTVPFAVAAWLLAGGLRRVWHPTGNGFQDVAYAWVVSTAVVALPWGMVLLVVLPPTLARFAASGRPADLASLRAVASCVRERYVEWNLVVVAITTSWALAALGLVVAGVGVVPGAFYAILVSAHACAALGPDRTAR